MAIPKIIHQVWEGRTEPEMPIRLKILARTWKDKNPDWEYHLWNGEEMDELVETHFPEYLDMYKNFPYNVQRWDTIRYMILYIYGGVYTDLDTECFKSINPLVENIKMAIGEEPIEHNVYPNINHLIGNAFMASEKGNDEWLRILEEIKNIDASSYKGGEIVLYTTGPFMISKIYPDIVKSKENIKIFSYKDVTPVTLLDMRHYILSGKRQYFNNKINNSYCAHYFFGSWNTQCI